MFSEFCEDIWKGIGRFRRESSFRTWAYAVAWNAARMYRRDPFRRRAQRLQTSDYSRLADRLAKSSLLHADPLAVDRLARLRATLTPFEQSMLILRIDKGLPWREIAEILAEDGTARRPRHAAQAVRAPQGPPPRPGRPRRPRRPGAQLSTQRTTARTPAPRWP